MDSVEPWLAYANSKGKGAFVLMRTSNKGMRDFQYLELRGEAPISVNFKNKNHGEHGGTRSFWYKNHLPLRETPCNSVVKNIKFMMLGKVPKLPPMRLYHAVGGKLAELAAANMGKYGYGAFGAVAGCTEQEEAAALRAMYPNLFFLIPGYGAQGGAADDAALLLRQGNGGVVNASRSILKAWSAELKTAEGDSQSEELADAKFAAEAALRAALEMRDAIRAAVAKTGNGSQP
jgi:orotidine-5'-phosphate decarboxylase